MWIEVDGDGAVRLVERDNFKGLSVKLLAGSTGSLEAIGVVTDPDHVYIEPSLLISLAAAASDTAWLERFDAMIAFAADHGWLDSAGRVRAHIEVSDDG